MLTFHMVYSEKCHACKTTKPLVREVLTHYYGVVNVAWEDVEDKAIGKIFEASLGVPLNDPTVSPAEAQRIREAGGEMLHALPTMYLTSSKRPMAILWKELGGVNPDSNDKVKKAFKKQLHLEIQKWQKKEMRLLSFWQQGADQDEQEDDDGRH